MPPGRWMVYEWPMRLGLPGAVVRWLAYTLLCTTTAIDIASAVPNLLQLGQGGAPALAEDMGHRGPMGTEV